MATDRLKIYNGALQICGEQRLANLSENRNPRYELDTVWNDGGVRYCLEAAQWHFAMRSTRLNYEPSITPDWGFVRAFTKPTDWVSTSGVFQEERLQVPLTQYADEVYYYFADLDQIYVKYVSDHVNFGMDFSKWPASFTDYVKAYFASKIIFRLPGGVDKVDAITHPKTGVLAKAQLVAKNRAAMTQPATFPTRGTWAMAIRAGRRPSGNFDGGNQSQLIG